MKGRILGIDYGRVRTGLATTDPDQIIVSGLETVNTEHFRDYILKFIDQEDVVKIVFGKPQHKDGTPTSLWKDIVDEVNYIASVYPGMKVDFIDESFTSMEAKSIMIRGGIKKKKRRDKKTVDKISAILILQKYLGHI